MNESVKYLEAAKLEEVARELKSNGFRIRRPRGSDSGYDLVATGKGKKIAVQVKAKSELRSAAAHIDRLRRQAIKQGFDEFRLVVAAPPLEVNVNVAGVDQQQLRRFRDELPPDLDEFPPETTIKNISHIGWSTVEVIPGGMRVAGTGVVDVETVWRDGNKRSPVATDFPFSFDVSLDSDLKIVSVRELRVDTSSFFH